MRNYQINFGSLNNKLVHHKNVNAKHSYNINKKQTVVQADS